MTQVKNHLQKERSPKTGQTNEGKQACNCRVFQLESLTLQNYKLFNLKNEHKVLRQVNISDKRKHAINKKKLIVLL
jgi:hypothetical protein